MSERGYRAAGTWLDESQRLLEVASPLDRLDPGPITWTTPRIGVPDVIAVRALGEAMGAAMASLLPAFEELGRNLATLYPALRAHADATRAPTRRQGRASNPRTTTRGRPNDYPPPPR